ncbi:MAG: hypothetical protein HXS53_08355 [Theionarchaea archaeon]|nr:hypothetical protein [Theionarchaea archaeon]
MNRKLLNIFIIVIVLLIYALSHHLNLEEIITIDKILNESLRNNILLCIAAAWFSIILWKYIKKSERVEIPAEIPVPLEWKWKEEIGKTIKTWNRTITGIVFIILLVFMDISALYITSIIYFSLNLTQYFLLTPKFEIHNDILAVVMILAFLIIVMMWSQIDIFFPEGTILFFIFFLVAFIWLFYGGGIEEFHWWLRHRNR